MGVSIPDTYPGKRGTAASAPKGKWPGCSNTRAIPRQSTRRAGRHQRAGAVHVRLCRVGRGLVGDDLDGHPELHVGMQFHRNLVDTERLDGLVETEATPIERHTSLGLDRVDDVRAGH